jgi:hypothetical protein
MDTFDSRLAAAADRLAGFAPALTSGGSWPLAERFDTAPEAAWGPPEVLAHLEEMLPYWLGEVERIIDMHEGPAPFGRVATDEIRLSVIARDRTLPLRELVARIDSDIARWRRRWAALDDEERARIGVHPRLGEMSVTAAAERFAADHLEEHLDQLAGLMAGGDVPA